MYIKIINGTIENYSIEQLRRDNLDISFPRTISKEILKQFHVYPCTYENLPSIDEKTQKIEDGGFVQNEDKNWIKTWKIVDKTNEEVDSWVKSKANVVKNKRNQLLLETDYLALSDNTMSPEMAEYRQNLRDITSQVGFPENVIWPIKPA